MTKSNSTLQADYLSKGTREFLESCGNDIDTRIRGIENEMWIGYEAARNLVDRIERLINQPRLSRMHSLLVIGYTDNGKTSVRKRIEEKHRHRATPDGKVHFPVVSIQMPPDPDERGFYNALMRGIFYPPHIAGKIDHIRHFTISNLQDVNVKLVMIDEVQHIDRMPYRKQRTLMDSIKYMSTELCLPFVAFGTEEAVNVFGQDPQLDNRFKKVHLPLWEANEALLRLLTSIEQVLPLKEPSMLSNEDLALHIFRKTNGTIGEINTLLRNAAILALKAGQEKITREIIDKINFESSPVLRPGAGN